MSYTEEMRPAVQCAMLGTVPGVVGFLRVLGSGDVECYSTAVWKVPAGDVDPTPRHVGPTDHGHTVRTSWPTLQGPSHSRKVSCGAVLSDGCIVTGAADYVLVLRKGDGSVSTLNCQGTILCVAHSGLVVAAGLDGGWVDVFDTATGTRTAHFIAHKDGVSALAFVPGTDSLATAGWDHLAKLWSLAERQPRLVASFEGMNDTATSCAVSSRGEWLAACSSNQTLIWAIPRRDLRAPCSPTMSVGRPARFVAFAPGFGNSLQLWAAQALCLWDIPTNAVVDEVQLDTGRAGQLLTGAVDGSCAICAVQHDGDDATTLYRCLQPLSVAAAWDAAATAASSLAAARERLLLESRRMAALVRTELSEKRDAQRELAEAIQRDKGVISDLSARERQSQMELAEAEKSLDEVTSKMVEAQNTYEKISKDLGKATNSAVVLRAVRSSTNLDGLVDEVASLKNGVEDLRRDDD
eukprot:m51a1_g1073 putative wd40 repeat-containing protein (466) ;mRNA; r:354-1936